MNNEPVAYLVKAPDGEYLVFEKSQHPVMSDCTYIPLYIHPAKTLTDEEIKQLYENSFDWDKRNLWTFNYNDFARAILRKAQNGYSN